jgi:putative flavoprotein involved in K+ transport
MRRVSDAIVIGAGQAGLSVSHELLAAGIDHVVLERAEVGASWARLWDSFRLNTPNWSIDLPGRPYDGADPDGFMSRDEIVSFLRAYRDADAAEVHEGVEVSSLIPDEDGFALDTSDGPLGARAVVVCTGAYQASHRPPGAGTLPAGLPVLDATTYRSPAAIPEGTILIVGGGQSGCQIAEDLIDVGRDVVLSIGKAAWAPRRIGDHDVVWWALETGFLEQTLADLPSPMARLAANITASGVDGGHDLSARTLRAKGATVAGRFLGAADGYVRFADDLAESIAWSDARYADLVEEVGTLCVKRGMSMPAMPRPEPFDPAGPIEVDLATIGAVVFTGGFRPDYGWIPIAGALDDMGFPVQTDGASAVAPGLFFAGVHFLRRRRSSLLCGVGDDAAIVAAGVRAHLAAG